jgi:transcriptional regulator with XRE-family HTH domain
MTTEPTTPKLRQYREARGWTQRQLAKRSGVHHRTIGNVEKGAKARLSTRVRLLRALDLPFEMHLEVFGPTWSPPPKGEQVTLH